MISRSVSDYMRLSNKWCIHNVLDGVSEQMGHQSDFKGMLSHNTPDQTPPKQQIKLGIGYVEKALLDGTCADIVQCDGGKSSVRE